MGHQNSDAGTVRKESLRQQMWQGRRIGIFSVALSAVCETKSSWVAAIPMSQDILAWGEAVDW